MATRHRLIPAMGMVLSVSLEITLLLLILEGRSQEAIPLHLCSLSAVAAIWLSVRPCAFLFDFLWYLGMPGAALALVFPAPAISRFQLLLNLSYVITHGLILLIPCIGLLSGMRPRRKQTPVMMGVLMLVSCICEAVNRRLGTDFLFLAAPPAGTPLEGIFAFGILPYRLFLGLMMLMICLIMDHLADRIASIPFKKQG